MENCKIKQSAKVTNERNKNIKNKNKSLNEISHSQLMEQLEKGIVYENLPKKQPSQIRIFLSSTFKDFELEKNYLIEHIYEPLRKFCNEKYQKDFNLIDLRWNIMEESMNQNLRAEMYLNEINKCKNESIGPYFVCFLSHRYGAKFLKPIILENEFKLIRKKASKQVPYEHITSLMDYCYELDANNIKNRSFKLKNTNDIMQKLNIHDKDKWEELSNTLVDQIRKAAENLYTTGAISKLERDKYFISVTEQEIKYGLLKENNPNRKCVAFLRNIKDKGTINATNNNFKSFIEDQYGESQLNRLKDLIDKKLSSNQNKRTFQIEWNKSNEFKEPYTKEINEYLKEFGDAFQYIFTRLIKDNMNDISTQSTKFEGEIFHHALLCNRLAKQSIRRDDLTQKVQFYLDDESNKKPLIVAGALGSGKSTILARTIKYLKRENDVFIYRFIGTSRESSNMKSIMLSILRQLTNIYRSISEAHLNNIDLNNHNQDKQYETLSKIKDRLMAMLNNISTNYKHEKLVIVLDSIDQLSKADYSLEWFIFDLPKNIKMIYSVIPDYCDISTKLKLNLEFKRTNYLKIGELGNSAAKQMLKNWLTNIDRKLNGTSIDKNTTTQWSFVNEILSKTERIYPLHIRIIFDIVSKWPSWYKVEKEFKSCITTKETIKYIFKGLEICHGQILFSRCVFYLTLFEHSGISEAELEDILSIDDELLNSVFVYYHPPVRRFQIALWLKIKYDLKDYITNKETDGVSVISWFHRSFIEASQEYYEDMFNGDLKDKLLMHVVDYFTEKYNENRSNGSKGMQKEFEYKKTKENEFLKLNLVKINEIKFETYAAFRYTKSQKLKSIKTSNNQNIVVYNKRKLNEMVNVISMMQDNLNKVELLKEHVYFNYEFMHAKCELRELNFIFEMDPIINKLTINFINHQKIYELNEINQIYKQVYPRIRQDPKLLNIEVLSRLSDNKSHYVEEFQKPSGLKLMSKNFVEKETEKDLFVVDSSFKIGKFYQQFNGELLFIESIIDDDEEMTIIDVIYSTTSKSIGSIQFDKRASHIQVELNNENTNDLNQLKEINGFVYFANGDRLFNYSFANHSLNFINSFETEIEGLLLLNSTYLLVILRDSLFLLNLQNFNDYGKLLTEPTFRENSEIQFIESTIPKETVFNPQYLDSVDSISIIVGLEDSHLIKIYNFNNNNKQKLVLLCTIYSIKWSFYGYTKIKRLYDYESIWRESVLIDESFMTDNMTSTTLSRVLIKFALQHEGVTKIIEVNDKGEFSIVDVICENIFRIDDKDIYEYVDYYNESIHKAEVELEAFKNDKILFKLRCGNIGLSWYIYLYNIEKKSINFKIKIEHGFRVNAYLLHGLIVSQYHDKLILYKINDDETINQLSSVNTSYSENYNEINREIKIKNGKLLRIEPLERLTIKEIDYLNESKEFYKKDLARVHHLNRMYEIDCKHILVKEESEIKVIEEEESVISNFAIVDVNDQKIVRSEVLMGDFRIKDCKNGYLILFNWDINDLIVNKIENKQGSFEFKQIFKQQIKGKFHSSDIKCHFNELMSNRFIISLHDKTNDKVEVRFMEEYDEDKLMVSLSTVSVNKIDLKHDEISCVVTSLNKYLVLYQHNERLTYLMDINGDKIIDNIEMDLGIKSVESILNSNDLIVGCEKCLYYIKYDINSNKLNKIRIKEYQQVLQWIEIQHKYLLVILDGLMEIYKLDDTFKSNIELGEPIQLVKDISGVKISRNEEYLIINSDTELCIYKLDSFKQIASLYFNDEILESNGIVSNEDYISLRLLNNSSLITFKIIENT